MRIHHQHFNPQQIKLAGEKEISAGFKLTISIQSNCLTIKPHIWYYVDRIA